MLDIKEHLRDSKKDVDRWLKMICEQFIADTSSNILSSVLNFNSRVNTFLTMRGDKSAKLSTQPWGDTNTTKGYVADTVRKIKQMVGDWLVMICCDHILHVPGATCAEEDAALPGQQGDRVHPLQTGVWNICYRD